MYKEGVGCPSAEAVAAVIEAVEVGLEEIEEIEEDSEEAAEAASNQAMVPQRQLWVCFIFLAR